MNEKKFSPRKVAKMTRVGFIHEVFNPKAAIGNAANRRERPFQMAIPTTQRLTLSSCVYHNFKVKALNLRTVTLVTAIAQLVKLLWILVNPAFVTRFPFILADGMMVVFFFLLVAKQKRT